MDGGEDTRSNGMTSEEYKGLVLRSADEDGHLHPPRITNWFLMQGILIVMEVHDRTIKTISAASEPMRYALTDKGRDAAERGRK